MRQSIFLRILAVCLLSLAIIFSVFLGTVNKIVYDQAAAYAEDVAGNFAAKTADCIVRDQESTQIFLQLISQNLLAIDASAPGAESAARNAVQAVLLSSPHIYSVWFSFEPGAFFPDRRYALSVTREGGGSGPYIRAAAGTAEGFPPAQMPPSGPPRFKNAEFGYVGAANIPLKRGLKEIGYAGIERLYADTFRFLDDKQIPGRQLVLLMTQAGEMIYAPDGKHLAKSIFNMPFEQKELLRESLQKGGVFHLSGISPVSGVSSNLYFNPVYTEPTGKKLYLCVDFPTAVLFKNAASATRQILLTSAAGLTLLSLLLFFTIRAILKPIKKLTEDANRIAGGNLDVKLDTELSGCPQNGRTKNEIHILFMALKKMLDQLGEAQELRIQAVQTRYEKEKAEDQARIKSEFLARMSHEIRTPLNAMIGMAELSLREALSPTVYGHALNVRNAGKNLLSLINDILDFSRIESGKMEILHTEYEVASLIDGVISIIRVKSAEKSLLFTVHLDSRMPGRLIGDEARIRQVLINLLSNAVKYTRAGFVSVSVDGEVKGAQEFLLRIVVGDSGVGVKPEDMGSLFDDFVRADAAVNKNVQGSGLGLPIVKSLCAAMGGDISVCSRYGGGSEFTVTLPQAYSRYERFAYVPGADTKKVLLYETREIYAASIADALESLGVECRIVKDEAGFRGALCGEPFPFAFVSGAWVHLAGKIIEGLGLPTKLVKLSEFGDSATEDSMETLTMPVHARSIARVLNGETGKAESFGHSDGYTAFSAPLARVLIVDDIPTNRMVAEGLMAPYNIGIDTCESGEEAVMRVQKERYDAVFMDHMMPGMDGAETTRKIRGIPGEYYASLPIIALTANTVAGVSAVFTQAGMNDFIPKPIETARLHAVLERWIPREKREQQQAPGRPPATDRIQVAGLDAAAGIAATGGDGVRYAGTLRLFCRDGAEKAERMQACLKDGDIRLYTVHVHGLKSALLSIGAPELSALAKNLEEAGLGGDRAYIAQNNGAFLARLNALIRNIKSALPAGAKDAGLWSEADKAALITLKNALGEMDASAIDGALAHLRGRPYGGEPAQMLESIYEHILIFEYDGAQSLIDQILSRFNAMESSF